MILNKVKNCQEDERCNMKHVDKMVMVGRILREFPCQIYVTTFWDRRMSIKITSFLEESNDFKVFLEV